MDRVVAEAPALPREAVEGGDLPSFMVHMALHRQRTLPPRPSTPPYSDFDARDPAWRELVQAPHLLWKPRIR